MEAWESSRRPCARRATTLAVLAATVLGAAAAPAGAVTDGEERLPGVDRRVGTIAPTAAQRARVADLGASAQWTRFGTPSDLYSARGVLASGLSRTSDVAAARQFLKANATLYKLGAAQVDALDVLHARPAGAGSAVLFRQRLGALPAGHDGLIAVAVRDGSVIYASSSNTGDTSAPAKATLTGIQAWLRAARDVRLPVSLSTGVSNVATRGGWTTFSVPGVAGTQYVRKVALPTPSGNREAYEALVLDDADDDHGPLGYGSFVDGRTGEVLVRTDRVDNLATNPRWQVFPSTPSTVFKPGQPAAPQPPDPNLYDYVDTDLRQTWCWVGVVQPDPDVAGAGPCRRVLFNEAPDDGFPSVTVYLREWDRIFDPAGNSAPSFASTGNNADTEQTWLKNDVFPAGGDGIRNASLSRDYIYPWGDVWNNTFCNPASLAPPGAGNDIQPAMANLFAQHNRMHDWSYHLGFEEQTYNLQAYTFGRVPPTQGNDPEKSGAQTGAIAGKLRNNANQRTLPDGIPGYTNMYLWQPTSMTVYPPCVDGDFDMSVIGHEYTHAISNRMVGGPDAGLDTREGDSMGESWSDLVAVEYLQEYKLVPVGDENPFSVGAYVTSNKQAGIRNYGMNDNPDLQYGDIGYDIVGPQVHADGEIWSATNYDLRQALIARHNGSFPASNATLQARCANGTIPADACPGNRRWMQIVFDAFLLMQPSVNMVSARNAYLAADRLRFSGANQSVMWDVFAKRGLGEAAESFPNGDGDGEPQAQSDPRPSHESPLRTNEATVKFIPTSADGGTAPQNAELFVGAYEARATPIMDTAPKPPAAQFDPTTTARFVPGTYKFVARAPGFGHVRFTRTFAAGQTLNMTVPMPRNVASSANGATAVGGTTPEALIDDTEETRWQSLNVPFNENGPEDVTNNPHVTVDLAGGTSTIRRVRVSAYLTPGDNRFTALRQFQVLTCNAAGAVTCANDADYVLRYTSPAAAFPSVRWRPTAPTLYIRSFDVPDVAASHVRMRVVENQCTGFAGYHGEQDLDPTATTDCRTSAAADDVRAAELQVLKTNAAF